MLYEVITVRARHDLARLQIPPWLTGRADPRGRAREDEIARVERETRREERDQLGDGEDHVARPAVLHDRAVDLAPDGEVV